jgi:tetratricopeptide (TPR) repeat protein
MSPPADEGSAPVPPFIPAAVEEAPAHRARRVRVVLPVIMAGLVMGGFFLWDKARRVNTATAAATSSDNSPDRPPEFDSSLTDRRAFDQAAQMFHDSAFDAPHPPVSDFDDLMEVAAPPDAPSPGEVSASFELAMRHVAMGRHAAAIPLLEQIVAGDPRHLKALSTLGVAYAETDRLDDAKRVRESLARIDANSASLLGMLIRARSPEAKIVDRGARSMR